MLSLWLLAYDVYQGILMNYQWLEDKRTNGPQILQEYMIWQKVYSMNEGICVEGQISSFLTL